MQSIGFENFKCFKNRANFEFRNITVLTGTNNSGKSTILSGLELMVENFKNNDNFANFYLDKPIELKALEKRYGNLAMFVNRESDNKIFYFIMKEFYEPINDYLDIKVHIEVIDNIKKTGIIKKIEYLNPQNEIIINLENKKIEDKSYYLVNIDFKFFLRLANEIIQSSYDFVKEYEIILADIQEFKLNEDIKAKIKNFNEKFGTMDTFDYWEDGNGLFHYLDLKNFSLPFGVDIDFNFCKQLNIENNNIINAFFEKHVINKNCYEEIETLFSNYYNSSFKEAILRFEEEIYYYLSNGLILQNVEYEEVFPIFLPQNDVEFQRFNKYPNAFNAQHKKYGIGSYEIVGFFQNNNFFEKAPVSLAYDFVRIGGLRTNIEFDRENKPELKDQIDAFIKDLINPFYTLVQNNIDYDKKIILPESTYKESLISALIYNCALKFKITFETLPNSHLGTNRLNHNRITETTNSRDNIISSLIKIEAKDASNKPISLEFIKKWIKALGIADNFEIENDDSSAIYKFFLVNDNKKELIADLGFGYNQILPIIISIASCIFKNHPIDVSVRGYSRYESESIYIEEPEANLHPALQSKLADLFADAIEHGVKLIIETHSEYLIRKLQYLVASNKSTLKKDDVVIYYLYPPNHTDVVSGEVEQVKKIEILEDGYLSDDFGTGFFDEAQKIAISLFGLNKSQKN